MTPIHLFPVRRLPFLAKRTFVTASSKLPPFLSFTPSPDAPIHPMRSSAVNADLPLPAILVLQEWWGVNEQIKSHAQRIANMTGCVCVVPDLYNGRIGHDKEVCTHKRAPMWMVWSAGLIRKLRLLALDRLLRNVIDVPAVIHKRLYANDYKF